MTKDDLTDETARRAWLADRRADVVSAYDAEAPAFDAHEYPAPLHPRFVRALVETTPPGGVILDAPCGTGRYFAQVTGAGRRVVGIDQSAGMLAEAQRRGLATELHHVGLQELAFEGEFDAAMTIDAMENVAPEDWPLVLSNLVRAVRPGGHLYLTVEEVEESVVERTYADAMSRGLPVVRGEVVEGDVAGYHYYPGRQRVFGWLRDAGLSVVEEDVDQQEGYGYLHVLARRTGR